MGLTFNNPYDRMMYREFQKEAEREVLMDTNKREAYFKNLRDKQLAEELVRQHELKHRRIY